MRYRVFGLFCVGLLAVSTSAVAQQIRGDYVETRSADVYTGQCFANGEVNLVGREAILAWHIQSGSWQGVPLDGLTIAAAVHAQATLGDPYANPIPRRPSSLWTIMRTRNSVLRWLHSHSKWAESFCATRNR